MFDNPVDAVAGQVDGECAGIEEFDVFEFPLIVPVGGFIHDLREDQIGEAGRRTQALERSGAVQRQQYNDQYPPPVGVAKTVVGGHGCDPRGFGPADNSSRILAVIGWAASVGKC